QGGRSTRTDRGARSGIAVPTAVLARLQPYRAMLVESQTDPTHPQSTNQRDAGTSRGSGSRCDHAGPRPRLVRPLRIRNTELTKMAQNQRAAARKISEACPRLQ